VRLRRECHEPDLNSLIEPRPDWHLFNATSINASGQITGYGVSTGLFGASS